MSYTRNQVVHAFHRLFGPIVERLDEAERWDAGFDGGEFSGPFYADAWQDEFGRCLKVISDAFGITEDEVQTYLDEADDLQFRHWWSRATNQERYEYEHESDCACQQCMTTMYGVGQ